MKQLNHLFLLFMISSFLFRCSPVLSDLQSARHLEEGQIEVTPAGSWQGWSKERDQDQQYHVGVQAGLGVSKKLEARLRYELINYSVDFSDTDDPFFSPESETLNIHSLAMGMKYSLIEDRLSVYLPVGFGFGSDAGDVSQTLQAQPTLLFTHRFADFVEVTPSVKYLWLFDNDDFYGFNLGAGLSTDLDKWAIRPEFGYFNNSSVGGYFWHFSVGFSWRTGVLFDE